MNTDNKPEAEQAYIEAKKTIAEIKVIQKNIEKLFAEIREILMRPWVKK